LRLEKAFGRQQADTAEVWLARLPRRRALRGWNGGEEYRFQRLHQDSGGAFLSQGGWGIAAPNGSSVVMVKSDLKVDAAWKRGNLRWSWAFVPEKRSPHIMGCRRQRALVFVFFFLFLFFVFLVFCCVAFFFFILLVSWDVGCVSLSSCFFVLYLCFFFVLLVFVCFCCGFRVFLCFFFVFSVGFIVCFFGFFFFFFLFCVVGFCVFFGSGYVVVVFFFLVFCFWMCAGF